MPSVRTLAAALLALGLGAGAALAATADTPDLRVMVQEVVYQIMPDGSSRPIDHRALDVFDVRFTQQYASVDRAADDLEFGLVYFAVPRAAEDEEEPNYNVYLYMRDGTHEMVTDGYRNNEVPGALFKMTAMLMERDGDRAYARLMHCVAPRPGQGAGEAALDLEGRRVARELDERVRALLGRR